MPDDRRPEDRFQTLLAAGWRALDDGAWDEAARAFAAACELQQTAPALEGLAWAAWWRNDAEVLFDARERAFHAYRAADDPVAAARMAIWLGCDHHDFRGEHALASGWHLRARRLLSGLPTTVEHGWLAFQEGAYALELADDTATAEQRAVEVAAVARELHNSDLEFLTLALRGLALVTRGEVEAGMPCLDEAGIAATSGEVRERVATTWTLCYLLYACERVRDFDRAAQWCRKMEEISRRFMFELGVGLCRVHYAGVLVLHGRWERAEQELLEAGTTLARVRPPAGAESDARLGELRRRQGRLEEAAALFAAAEPHPLAVLGQAMLARDRDETRLAAEILEDLLDATPAGSLTQRADALALLVAARCDLGNVQAARPAEAELRGIAEAVGTGPLRAMAAQATAALAAAQGDTTTARRGYKKATGLYQASGLPFEAACTRLDLAASLAAVGRTEAAIRQAQRAAAELDGLGAQAAAVRAKSLLESLDRSLRAVDGEGAAAELAGLSPRELDVVALLTEGLSDREIGARLFISRHTVHRHVSNILTKLALPSRSAAAAFAARHGVAPPAGRAR